MRFSFAISTAILGLTAAVCAIPLGADSLVLAQADSKPTHDLDSRGLQYAIYDKTIEITYLEATDTSRMATPEQVQATAHALLTAAESALNIKDFKVKPLNTWAGSATSVKFTFELPVCNGKCQAHAFGAKLGVITAEDGKGKRLYSHIR